MAVPRAFVFFFVLLCCNIWLVESGKKFNNGVQKNRFILAVKPAITTHFSLGAPYYRNVSTGQAWMIPRDAVDLASRDLQCECFAPDGQNFHIHNQTRGWK